MRRLPSIRPPRRRDLLALARLWRLRRPGCVLCLPCVADAFALARARGGHRGPQSWEIIARAGERSCGCSSGLDRICSSCRRSLTEIGEQVRRGEDVDFVIAIEYLRTCGGTDCYCVSGVDSAAPSRRALTGEPPP